MNGVRHAIQMYLYCQRRLWMCSHPQFCKGRAFGRRGLHTDKSCSYHESIPPVRPTPAQSIINRGSGRDRQQQRSGPGPCEQPDHYLHHRVHPTHSFALPPAPKHRGVITHVVSRCLPTTCLSTAKSQLHGRRNMYTCTEHLKHPPGYCRPAAEIAFVRALNTYALTHAKTERKRARMGSMSAYLDLHERGRLSNLFHLTSLPCADGFVQPHRTVILACFPFALDNAMRLLGCGLHKHQC
jgi:hypothetical protein